VEPLGVDRTSSKRSLPPSSEESSVLVDGLGRAITGEALKFLLQELQSRSAPLDGIWKKSPLLRPKAVFEGDRGDDGEI